MDDKRLDSSTGVQNVFKHMQFRRDPSNGYMYCYAPSHPCANAAGKLMEHVYVMYNSIGRVLDKSECVHHIDRNRSNNALENLRLMDRKEHARLHQQEDNGSILTTVKCYYCGTTFTTTGLSGRKFCSKECSTFITRKFEVSKEELESLVWIMPTTKIAEIYRVSDVAVAKRCKKLGIEKPPRGYWSKPSSRSNIC